VVPVQAIYLGTVQVSPDTVSMPVVVCSPVSTPEELAEYLFELQNGVTPEGTRRLSYGDTALELSLCPLPGAPKWILVELAARRRPSWLTYEFVAKDREREDVARLFVAQYDRYRQYVLTVGTAMNPRFDLLYLVKYRLGRRQVG